jgi:leucine dehydrogenase
MRVLGDNPVTGVGHASCAPSRDPGCRACWQSLAKMLRDAGAKLVVCDVDRSAVERVAAETGAIPVAVDGIFEVPADIFAPCALGGVLNEASIGRISAKVVCGAANNQLATPEDGVRLADRGVLYAPDYVVNAGGIINVAAEYLGWTSEQAVERVEATGKRLSEILDHAVGNALAPHQAADDRARAIVATAASRAPVDA